MADNIKKQEQQQQNQIGIDSSKTKPDPAQYVTLMSNLCKKYITRQEFDAAYLVATEALEKSGQSPKQIQFKYYQAFVKFKQKKNTDSKNICLKAIEDFMMRKPNQEESLYQIFESYESLVNTLELLKEIEAGSNLGTSQLIEQYSDFFDSFQNFYKAITFWGNKDRKSAEKHFQETLDSCYSLAENDPQVFITFMVNLAQFYKETNQFQKGSDEIALNIDLVEDKGLEHKKFELYTYLNFFNSSLNKVKVSYDNGLAALELYEKIQQKEQYFSKYVALQANLSVSSLNLNKKDDAVKYIKKAVELSEQLSETDIELKKSILNTEIKFKQQSVY